MFVLYVKTRGIYRYSKTSELLHYTARLFWHLVLYLTPCVSIACYTRYEHAGYNTEGDSEIDAFTFSYDIIKTLYCIKI